MNISYYSPEPSSGNRDRNFKYISFYTVIFILFTVIGTLFCRGLFSKLTVSSDINSLIVSHFTGAFSQCSDLSDYIGCATAYAIPDLIVLASIALAGFTAFSIFICSVITAVRGFTIGFCIIYLTNSINNGLIWFGGSRFGFILYLTKSALLTVIFIYASMICVRFSKRLRRYIKLRAAKKETILGGLMFYIFMLIFIATVIWAVTFAYCSLLYSVAM